MKHPKFKYHKFNMIRRFLNKPYKYDHYALLNAWFYFQFRLYNEQERIFYESNNV